MIRFFPGCLLFAAVLFSAYCGQAQTIKVNDAAGFKKALQTAKQGTTIVLEPGNYTGRFEAPAGVCGTEKQPITIKALKNVVLSTGDTTSGYGLHLVGNQYWVLKDFTISVAKKGLILDGCSHILVSNLQIDHIGEEGIHLRAFSSYNVIENCTVTYTGLLSPGFGEACYIGSAVNNWEKHSGGKPDTSNYNVVRKNTFGPEVAAEGVDIKEGTTGNLIANNTFYGKGQKNINSGNSWMEVKGNANIIENNRGYDALEDGFQVTIKADGWGAGNIFRGNVCEVNGPGYGIKVQLKDGTPNGNVVAAGNTVKNAAKGLTNISSVSGSSSK